MSDSYQTLKSLKRQEKYIYSKFCEQYHFDQTVPNKKTPIAIVQNYLTMYNTFIEKETRLCQYCQSRVVLKQYRLCFRCKEDLDENPAERKRLFVQCDQPAWNGLQFPITKLPDTTIMNHEETKDEDDDLQQHITKKTTSNWTPHNSQFKPAVQAAYKPILSRPLEHSLLRFPETIQSDNPNL